MEGRFAHVPPLWIQSLSNIEVILKRMSIDVDANLTAIHVRFQGLGKSQWHMSCTPIIFLLLSLEALHVRAVRYEYDIPLLKKIEELLGDVGELLLQLLVQTPYLISDGLLGYLEDFSLQ